MRATTTGGSPRDTLRITILAASPNTNSKSLALAQLVAAEFSRQYRTVVDVVDVYRLGPGFTGAVTREDVDPQVESALESIENCDVLIPAVPVFRGAYPGLFKHALDLIDQYALARTPVLLTATGGSDRHSLVLDTVLRPLFGFFQAFVAPVGIYASSLQFDGTMLLDASTYTRIEVAVADLAPLLSDAARIITTGDATMASTGDAGAAA